MRNKGNRVENLKANRARKKALKPQKLRTRNRSNRKATPSATNLVDICLGVIVLLKTIIRLRRRTA